MGPSYAGILAPIAFLAMLARGLISGNGAEGVLFTATLSLFAFAAIGYVAGSIADQIVVESVQHQFAEEMRVRVEQGRSRGDFH